MDSFKAHEETDSASSETDEQTDLIKNRDEDWLEAVSETEVSPTNVVTESDDFVDLFEDLEPVDANKTADKQQDTDDIWDDLIAPSTPEEETISSLDDADLSEALAENLLGELTLDEEAAHQADELSKQGEIAESEEEGDTQPLTSKTDTSDRVDSGNLIDLEATPSDDPDFLGLGFETEEDTNDHDKTHFADDFIDFDTLNSTQLSSQGSEPFEEFRSEESLFEIEEPEATVAQEDVDLSIDDLFGEDVFTRGHQRS